MSVPKSTPSSGLSCLQGIPLPFPVSKSAAPTTSTSVESTASVSHRALSASTSSSSRFPQVQGNLNPSGTGVGRIHSLSSTRGVSPSGSSVTSAGGASPSYYPIFMAAAPTPTPTKGAGATEASSTPSYYPQLMTAKSATTSYYPTFMASPPVARPATGAGAASVSSASRSPFTWGPGEASSSSWPSDLGRATAATGAGAASVSSASRSSSAARRAVFSSTSGPDSASSSSRSRDLGRATAATGAGISESSVSRSSSAARRHSFDLPRELPPITRQEARRLNREALKANIEAAKAARGMKLLEVAVAKKEKEVGRRALLDPRAASFRVLRLIKEFENEDDVLMRERAKWMSDMRKSTVSKSFYVKCEDTIACSKRSIDVIRKSIDKYAHAELEASNHVQKTIEDINDFIVDGLSHKQQELFFIATSTSPFSLDELSASEEENRDLFNGLINDAVSAENIENTKSIIKNLFPRLHQLLIRLQEGRNELHQAQIMYKQFVKKEPFRT